MFTLLDARLARADGGMVLLHEAQGPFSVTVFFAPEGAQGGLTDLSALVQWRTNGQVVLDANVSLALDPLPGSTMTQSDPVCGLPSAGAGGAPLTVRATREQASNKLLYGAPLNLSAAGACLLHVTVSRGPDYARFDCLLPVAKESPKLARLWPYLAFPPIAVTVFALNQKLRRHSLEQTI